MAKFVLGVAAIAVCFVLFRGVLTRSEGTALPSAQVNTTGVPQEFRSLIAYQPDPGAILSSRGALPGLGAIRRLVGHHDSGDAANALCQKIDACSAFLISETYGDAATCASRIKSSFVSCSSRPLWR